MQDPDPFWGLVATTGAVYPAGQLVHPSGPCADRWSDAFWPLSAMNRPAQQLSQRPRSLVAKRYLPAAHTVHVPRPVSPRVLRPAGQLRQSVTFTCWVGSELSSM